MWRNQLHAHPGLVNDLFGTTTGIVLTGLDIVTSISIIELLSETGLTSAELTPYIGALNQIIQVCNEYPQICRQNVDGIASSR